ncbi:glutathione S-transferase family protein [Devosia sp. Root635]|uniref:glutathione S-transferase family protein n=1 Tax=Devosia sp. Root635 TaxID=1736575 RepID=UPI0007007EEF|nr:glutathione S-transferase family protein [Devosia sp. Root635]KRA42238.1 glutathione S-transferase [Devosia sp. Root635]
MTATITAFATSPDRGAGLARDMRLRWAFEEVGQPYDVRLVSFAEMKQPAHRALNPFGQIPTYEEGGLALFETGSIIIEIARNHPGLLPDDANTRARAITWMFAAVSTVEQPIVEYQNAKLLESDKSWAEARMPVVKDRIRERFNALSAYLGDAEWIDGDFSAADIMLVHVMLRARSSGIIEEYANISAYIARAQARPAYQRAFAAQLAVYAARPTD